MSTRSLWSRVGLRGLQLLFALSALFFLFADRRSGHILASVTVLTCLLVFALPPIRIAGRFVSPLLTAPVAWLASILATESVLPPRCSARSVAQNAAPLILQLDEYRRVHGHYPATLAAANITSPRYRCGTFIYTLDSDGSCGLMIGDYARDDFAALWNSKTREWDIDT
jgi:hypothetical protein